MLTRGKLIEITDSKSYCKARPLTGDVGYLNNIYYDCANKIIVADAVFFANGNNLKSKIETKKFVVNVDALPEYLETIIKNGYSTDQIYSKWMVPLTPAYLSSLDNDLMFRYYPDIQSPFGILKGRSKLNKPKMKNLRGILKAHDENYFRPIPVCDFVIKNQAIPFFGAEEPNVLAYLRSKLVSLVVLNHFMHAAPESSGQVLKSIHSDPLEWNNAIHAVKAVDSKIYDTTFQTTREIQIKIKPIGNDSIGKFLFHKALINVINKGEVVINAWNLRLIHTLLLKYCKETQIKGLVALVRNHPSDWLQISDNYVVELAKILLLKSLFGDYDMRVCYDILGYHVSGIVLGNREALIELGKEKFRSEFGSASLNRIFKAFNALYDDGILRSKKSSYVPLTLKEAPTLISVSSAGNGYGTGYLPSATTSYTYTAPAQAYYGGKVEVAEIRPSGEKISGIQFNNNLGDLQLFIEKEISNKPILQPSLAESPEWKVVSNKESLPEDELKLVLDKLNTTKYAYDPKLHKYTQKKKGV